MTSDASDSNIRFPIGEFHRDDIVTNSGRPLSDMTLDNVLSHELSPDDVAIHRRTLEQQSAIAREAGFAQVADNLARAAEMADIPNTELLELYEALRPGRSTYYQLLSLSQRLTSMYGAELTGAYIREAADAYRDTGLLKMDD